MVRLNGGLDRRAAHKASYREVGEEDDLRSPESAEPVSRNNRKAHTTTTAFDDQEDDEEGVLGPSQKSSRKKRKAAQDALKQSKPSLPSASLPRNTLQAGPHTATSSDNESSADENDPSHATGENSRVRINQVIKDLVKAEKDTLTYCDTTPLKDEPRVQPPALDLGLIKLSTDSLLFLDDSVLYGYLTSNDFLPCIAQWKKECIDNSQLRSLLLAALPNDEYPFVETATYLAQTAPKYVNIIEEQRTLDHPHAEIMLICVKYVWRLKRCTMAHFMHFLREAEYPHLEDFVYLFCARALLTVYADIRLHSADGFFAIMLDSRFAEPMTLEARRAWDKLLIFPSNSSGADTATSVSTIQAASIAYAKGTGFKSNATPLSEEATRELHFKVEAECWKLRTAFVDAVGDSPELKIIVPSDVGQTEALKRRKREKKAGRPPQFKREMVSFCDSNCTPETDTHSRECTDRLREAQEEWREAKGSVEADVPDQDPARVNFTFQQKQSTLISPEQVISRFNQRDVVEPFSDEEKLVAFRRFRMVLNLVKGETVDRAFEWTMISEVLAGRGVADCVRFYYQHKHIIFMKLDKRPDPEQPFVPTGVPDWDPRLSPEQHRQARQIFDVDRFEQHIATLQADNTDLRIRNEILEADAVRMRSSENYHRSRGDRNMQSYKQKAQEVERLTQQLKTVQLQKNREDEIPKKQLMTENESLNKQLAESKAYAEEQKKLAADSKKFGEWQERLAEEYLEKKVCLQEELDEAKEQLRYLQPSTDGQGFLKGISHTHTPRQWRGEM